MSSSPSLPSPSAIVPLSRKVVQRKSSGSDKENAESSVPHGDQNADFSPHASPQVPFVELVGNFGYTSRRTASPERIAGEAPTKRRRIELTDAKSLPPIARKLQELPRPVALEGRKRSKSPTKKRPQTITALATAAYKPQEPLQPHDNIPEPHGVTKKPVSTAKKRRNEDATAEKVKKPRKPRAKPAAKDGAATKKKPAPPKKPAKNSSKDSQPKQALYPPEQANAQIRNQDFLFGTSSQLAAPESPTFIREMQLAIHYSEPSMDVSKHKSSVKVPTAPHGTNLSVEQGSRELWGTAARDLSGGVTRAFSTMIGRRGKGGIDQPRPTSSNAKAPCIPAEVSNPRDRNLSPDFSTKPTTSTGNDPVYVDLDEIYSALNPDKSMTTTSDPTLVGAARCRVTDIHQTPKLGQANLHHDLSDMLDLDEIPPSTQQTKKPVKRTARKVNGTTKTAKAGRPSFKTKDDISDNEPHPTPSPPRRKAKATPATVNALTLSPSREQPIVSEMNDNDREGGASLALGVTANINPEDKQWQVVQRTLFRRITDCVTSTPRSKNMDEITWHEKILMYDPIILENFTAWLNDRGLRINVTRQKKKSTSRGKGRKKKGAESTRAEEEATAVTAAAPTLPEVETLEEELRPWMVQKWCEENSVCCCYANTLRGTARARF